MSQGYDGSVKIDTEIDTRNLNSQMLKVVNQLKTAEKEVSRLESKLNELGNAKVPTAEYEKLAKAYEKVRDKADKLLVQQESLERKGQAYGGTYQKLAEKLSALDVEARALYESMERLENSGQAFVDGKQTEAYQKATDALNKQKGAVEQLTRRYEELAEKSSESSQASFSEIMQSGNVKGVLSLIGQLQPEFAAVTGTLTSIKNIIKSIVNVAKKVVSVVASIVEKVKAAAKTIASALASIARKVASVTKSIASKFSGVFSSITKNVKLSDTTLASFINRIKSLALRAFLFSQITKAFRSVVSEIKTSFETYLLYDQKMLNSINQLKGSLSTLGNSFISAFSPLISAVIPYIQQLVAWLTNAINMIAQLIATLTGQSYWLKATEVQSDYADSLKDTGKEAKKTAGALADFDDLHVLQKNNSDDSSSSGSGAGNGGGFEKVPISNKIKKLGDWLKDMWDLGDAYELGKKIGEWLRDALESIPWNKVYATARKVGKLLASAINGFIEVDRLGYDIGMTLANAFNTAFWFLNSFVHELHWGSLGQFIADTFNGFFENIDWPLIYDTVTWGLAGLSAAITNFVNEFNWDNISNTIINGITTLVDGIWAFIDGTIGENGFKFGGFHLDDIVYNLIDQLNKTLEGIPWKSTHDLLVRIVQDICEAVNVAIETFHWDNLSSTIDWVINTIIDMFAMEVNTVDTVAFAENLGDQISKSILGIDWMKFAATIAQSLTNLGKAMVAFCASIEWVEIGNAIGEAINKVINETDWYTIGQGFHDFVQGICDAVQSFVDTVDWNAVANAIAEFLDGLDWLNLLVTVGKTIANALAEVIVTAIQGVIPDINAKIEEQSLVKISADGFVQFDEDAVPRLNEIVDAKTNEARDHAMEKAKADFSAIRGETNSEVASTVEEAGNTAVSAFGTFDSTVGPAANESGIRMVKDLEYGFTEYTKTSAMNAKGESNPLYSAMANSVHQAGQAVEDEKTITFTSLSEFAKGLGNTFKGTVDTDTSYKDSGTKVGEDIGTGIDESDERVATAAEGLLQTITNTVSEASTTDDLKGIIATDVEEIISGIEESVTTFTEWFAEWKATALEEFETDVETYTEGFTTFLENINTIGEEQFTRLHDMFAEKWQQITDETTTTWTKITETLTTKWTELNAEGEKQFEKLRSTVETKFKKIEELAQKLGDKFKELQGTVESTFSGMASTVDAYCNQMMSKLDELLAKISEVMGALEDLANANIGDLDIGGGGHSISGTSSSGGTTAYPLANGAVIRGGNPFLAILGDQHVGHTNIEAPLDTIKDAVRDVLGEGGYSSGVVSPTIALNIDGSEFARLTLSDILGEMDRQGYDVEVLGV